MNRRGRWLNPKVKPEDEEEMRRLKESGMSYSEIAKLFGVSRFTVRYHLDSAYKRYCIEKAMEWARKNPERAKESNKRFRKRHASRYVSRCLKKKRQKRRLENEWNG
ncbi:MAG: helix-turn-helix domain-containing protein [Methanosarcinales archaeon]